MKLRYLSLVVVLLLAALPALAQVNDQALKDVASGKLKEAKASWWGFNAEDATACLQAAIDSKVPRLIVDNVGKPWIVLPIKLVSDQEIVFEKGVEVLAKRGEYKGGNDSLFSGRLVKNVTLTGPGATLRMWRDDYAAAPYTKAEWRHGVQFHSSTNIRIIGLTIAESGGDGIYLGAAAPGVTNKDILIRDVICDNNYRQGISVITAENLTIDNCVLSNTAGTAPMAGIDYEPNNPDERLVNCVMRNCRLENNAGGGIFIYVPPLNATSAPLSMRFENCTSRGDRHGFAIVTDNIPEEAVKGSVELSNCTFSDTKGPGIGITNVPLTGVKMRFENCTLENAAGGEGLEAPITITSRADATEDMGGYDFGRLVIKETKDRRPLAFVDNSGNVKLRDVKGTLVVERDGKQTETVLTDKLLGEWFPFITIKKLPRVKLAGMSFKPLMEGTPKQFDLGRFRTRTQGRFLLYATQGDQVTFKARFGQVGKYSGVTMPVIVTSPSGKEVAKVAVPFEGEAPVAFTAPETGLYRVEADAKGNYMQFSGNSNRMLLTSEGGSIRMFASTGDLFVYVPAGTTEFGIKLYGEGLGEGIKGAFYGPDGKLIEEKDNIAAAHQFAVQLAQPSKGEVYKLTLSKASKVFLEDNYIEVLGVPPLLAPSKEALLVPVQ
ncbi:MAG: right-handed parallel beta-helix repeat-containing protein [Armatimonadia bacterium]